MWELNGITYSQSEVQSGADEVGISFDEYVKKYNLKRLDEESQIDSDPFSIDTVTDLIGDDFYKSDARESSDKINKLLEGSDVKFTRDESSTPSYIGYGGGNSIKQKLTTGRLSYRNDEGEIITSDRLELDIENPDKSKKNTAIIKDFLKQKKFSQEEKDKFSETQEETLSTFESLVDEDPEVIQEKQNNKKTFNDPNLFTPYEVTDNVHMGKGIYTPVKQTIEPYKEDLDVTKQDIINSYKKSGKTIPSEDKLRDETESMLREKLLYTADLDTLYKATQRIISADPSLQDDIYVGALLSKERELSDLKKVQEKVQLNGPIIQTLKSAYPKFVKYLSENDKLNEEDYVQLQKDLTKLGILIDKTDSSPITLQNGVITDQAHLDAYRMLTNKMKGAVATHSSLMEKLVRYQTDANGDEMILSAANKNYDLVEKRLTETGVGFLDLGANLLALSMQTGENLSPVGMAKNLALSQLDVEEGGTGFDVKKYGMNDIGVQYNLWSNKMRDEYVDDVTFEDAFSNGENFGKFAAQEITKQIPILTAIILSGGAAAYTIGASTAGGKMLDMQTEIATGQKDWKDWEIWAKSLGYGVAEGGFAALSTIPILRAAKNSLSTGVGKSVVDNGMKTWWKNNSILAYAPFLESLAEGGTQVTQNLIDGVDPMLGVDHAGFTGFSFGILFGGVPFAQSVYNSTFSDYNKNKKIRGLLKEQQELGRKLSKARSPLMKKEYELQLKENAYRIQEASKEINNSVKENIRANGAQGYIGMIQLQETLRNSAIEIENDTTLNTQEKQELIKNLQKKYTFFENVKQKYLNDSNLQLYRPEFVQLESTDPDRYNSLMAEGRKIASKDRGPDYRPDKKEVERYAYEAYLEEVIRAENKKAGADGVSLRQFTTRQEALDYIDRQKDSGKYDEGKAEKAWAIVNEGGDGWADPNTDRSFVVLENQIINQRKGIATHEVGHHVFWKIFGRNSKAFESIAQQLLQTVKTSDPKFYKKWVESYPDANPDSKSYDSQEAIMRFIELAGREDFKLNEKRKGLAGFFGAMVQREFKDSFDFKGETDIVDFVVGLAKKIADGTLSKTDIISAKKSSLVPRNLKVDLEKQYDIAASTAPNTLNKLAKEYKDKSDTMSVEDIGSFVTQYRNVALKALGFDSAKGTITKEEAVSFVDKYFPNIIRGFKPDQGAEFSTYVTSTIVKKQQEFYKKEIGDKAKTTSLDDPRAQQVAADTETVPLQKDIEPTIDPLRLFTDKALKDKFIKTTEKALKDKDINALNYKTLKTLDEDAIADLIGIPAKKIFDPTANLSQAELTKALMFINKNASTLFNLLPKANTDLARVPYLNDPSKTTFVGGDPTGIPRTILNLFYDKGKRIGNNYQWSKKPGLTLDQFKNSLGIEGNIKSPDVKVRTNTSQAVKGILELTGRALTNKAVRDILIKQGFTPSQVLPIAEGKSDLMFSSRGIKRAISSVPLSKQPEVQAKFGIFAQGVKNGLSVDAAINQVYGFLNPKEKELLAETLKPVLNKIIVNQNDLETGKPKEIDIVKFLTDAVDEITQKEVVKKILGLRSGSLNFKNKFQLYGYFNLIDQFIDSKIKNMDNDFDKAFYIVNTFAPTLTAAAKVSDGSLTWETIDGLPTLINKKTGKDKGSLRYSLFANNGQMGEVLIKPFLKNPELLVFKNSQLLYNGKKLFNPRVSQTVSPALTSIKKNRKLSDNLLNKSKADAEQNTNAVIELATFFKKLKDTDAGLSMNDFGMFLQGANGDMSAMIRAAARLNSVAGLNDNLSLDPKKWRFEHNPPARTMQVHLANYIQGNITEAQLRKEFDNYTVSIIPKLMDDVINERYQDTSPLYAKNKWQRYYNEHSFGRFPYVTTVYKPTKDGKYTTEEFGKFAPAAYKSVQSAEVKNKKELAPVFKFSKSTPVDNQQVLDKMAEVDNTNNEEALAFSKSQNLSEDFNKIIENKTGIGADKVYSDVKAQVVGANKGNFNFFIPPSAEDFVGLLYKTLGKGKLGDAQMAWYKKNLLDPFATAMDNISRDRIALMNDFKALKKDLKIIPKNLKKKLPGEPFTQEQAVRTYIWNKQGMTPDGMSKKDIKELTDFVESKPELVLFADQLIALQKGDKYPAPKFGWLAGNITTDLMDGINTIKRTKYLEQWQYNVDEIFTKANLNKLEAAYGKGYRTALEGMLKRMRTGRNREFTSDSLTGRVTDWLTNSIGAIMFFNTRSAVLQTISAVNFINFKDNNIFAAGKAFANQPQFWKDFKTLFNSDFLVDRRNGLKLNVNEADIADMAKKGGVRGVISEMLRLGFLPTQIADSFAIASGGSSFYRNRIKKYTKEGMSKAEAEDKAFIDFREIAEEAQQSSRPDRISAQQAGPLGRIILAFANTPMQYTRLIKKAASDLKNGRGDTMTNISKIFYYGVAQNLLFNAMQQALFAIGFGDDEEETEKREEKYANIVNSMADSILRGAGIGGAIFSVLKNTGIKLAKEADKKSPKYQDVLTKEIAQLSPPVSSKLGKLRSAGRSYSWNKKEMMEKGFSLDNPAYLAAGQVIAATTNIPLDRAFKKIDNIRKASSSDYEAWARIAMLAGWADWEIGVKKEKPKKVKKPKKTSYKRKYKKQYKKRNYRK